MNLRLFLRLNGAPKRILFFVLSLWAAGASYADSRGVSPYLPLNMSPEVERQIDRLLAISGDSVLTRPIPASRVHDALERSCDRPNTLCRQVRNYLERFKQSDGVSYFNAQLNYKDDTRAPQVNARGAISDNAALINAQIYRRMNQHWYAFLGAERREDGESLEGSYSSFGWEWMQIDVGYRPHWFSPMRGTSITWSTNAETTPSLTVSNATPLTRLGLRYAFFATRLSESKRIEDNGRLVHGKPCAIGMHVSLNPLPSFSVGVNRVAMYGGGPKGECHQPKNLLETMFDPKAVEENSAASSSGNGFGNQLASISSRWNVGGKLPFSVYAEYAGEGASTGGTFKLDDTAFFTGVYLPRLSNELDARFEYGRWSDNLFQHPIYGDGFSNSGNVLGLADVDQTFKNDASGRSYYAELNWQHRVGRLIHIGARTVTYNGISQTFSDAYALTGRYSFAWNDRIWGLESMLGRDASREGFHRFGVFLRW